MGNSAGEGGLEALARYLRDTGTKQSWLAERVGTTGATMSRWVTGVTPMRDYDRRMILTVLRERAAVDLDGLFGSAPLATPPAVRARSGPPQRTVDQVRQTAKCRTCHQVREGVTTIARASHGDKPPGHAWHVCDPCSGAIVERPLDEVLLEHLNG